MLGNFRYYSMYIAVDSVLNSAAFRSYSCDFSHYFSGFRSYSSEMEPHVGGFFRVSMKMERQGSSFAQRNFSPSEIKLRNESPKISLRATNENQFSFTGHSFDNAFWPQKDNNVSTISK